MVNRVNDLFIATEKIWRVALIRGEKFSLLKRIKCPYHFSKSTKVLLATLSKYVIHYGPRPGFPYYYLTTPSVSQHGSRDPLHENALSNSVDLSPGNFHQYPIYSYIVHTNTKKEYKLWMCTITQVIKKTISKFDVLK